MRGAHTPGGPPGGSEAVQLLLRLGPSLQLPEPVCIPLDAGLDAVGGTQEGQEVSHEDRYLPSEGELPGGLQEFLREEGDKS